MNNSKHVSLAIFIVGLHFTAFAIAGHFALIAELNLHIFFSLFFITGILCSAFSYKFVIEMIEKESGK